MENHQVAVVSDSYGNIHGIYEVYEDAWDRMEELNEEFDPAYNKATIEVYTLNMDVELYDEDSAPNVIEFNSTS